jgi:hypothetical protein
LICWVAAFDYYQSALLTWVEYFRPVGAGPV